MRSIFALCALLLSLLFASAEGRELGIAYLNTGHVHSVDSAAIERVVRVVDSMRMPLVALFGVENEAAAREIAQRSESDYSYLHRTMDYYDGQDFALLYFGDRFFVERAVMSYGTLAIHGEADGESMDLILTRRGDRVRTLLPENTAEPSDITLLCGRVTPDDIARLELYDAMKPLERRGEGNVRGSYGWFFRSRIGCSEKCRAGVYITEWLLRESCDLPIYVIVR